MSSSAALRRSLPIETRSELRATAETWARNFIALDGGQPQPLREARGSLVAYHAGLNGWQIPWHQQCICEAFERLERTPNRRLIITMPPRHGKSETVTRSGVGWCLGRGQAGLGPINRVAITSYGMDLAAGWSATIRDDFADPSGYCRQVWPDAQLACLNEKRWTFRGQPKNRANCIAAGVAGPLNGKGFDLIIVDDPIKNPEEARSQAYRDKIWRWYQMVARIRLQPGGRIAVVMTPWHEDDLAGRLKAQGGWEELHLPALRDAETGEPDLDGVALWPEAYDAEHLRSLAADDPEGFNALYQGTPTNAKGPVWDRQWFDDHRVRLGEVPLTLETYTFWDCAAKDGQRNDYSAWVRGGYCPFSRRIWIVGMGQAKLKFPDLEAAAIEGRDGAPPWEVALVEDTSNGIALVQNLQHSGARAVIPVPVILDKVARANAVTGLVRSGMVLFAGDHPQYETLVANCTALPNGAHDDLNDALVGLLTFLRQFIGQEQAPTQIRMAVAP